MATKYLGKGTQSDLLIINKTDLAEAVGASLEVMNRDAEMMRQNGPTIFAQVKYMIGESNAGCMHSS